MWKILTPCSVTGRMIDTGIEIEKSSFARLPSFVGRIACPHCGGEQVVEGDREGHRW
jgi:hypothetical protein